MHLINQSAGCKKKKHYALLQSWWSPAFILCLKTKLRLKRATKMIKTLITMSGGEKTGMKLSNENGR